MDELELIRIMNETMIRFKQIKNQDYTINEVISEQLKDDSIFYKISKRNALNILTSVGVADDMLETTYAKLTNPNTNNVLSKDEKNK